MAYNTMLAKILSYISQFNYMTTDCLVLSNNWYHIPIWFEFN